MKIGLTELLDENEMLSHIFLECISRDDLIKIRDKYNSENNIINVPIEMKIGGISVNPKKFFDLWKNQMEDIIKEEANKMVTEKRKNIMNSIYDRLEEFDQILKAWENDINWDVINPLNKKLNEK